MSRILCSIKCKWAYVFLVPFFISIIGAVLLFLVSFIPDSWIFDHSYNSSFQLFDENSAFLSQQIRSPAGRFLYKPDTFTDSLIIESSYRLNSFSNALLNKVTDLNPSNHADLFMRSICGEDLELYSYSRYWMGFRIIIRPLLVLTAYYGIRIIFAALFYVLLIIAALTVSHRNSLASAVSFSISCLIVEHYSVSSSLQFSCCFLIMFVFVIFLNFSRFSIGEDRTFICFCFLGACTQFFDFYTYPLITCIFPLALLVERCSQNNNKLLIDSISLLFAWLSSYLCIWIMKLCYVTAFTPDNGFYDAFKQVAYRFGIGIYRTTYDSYSSIDALAAVWNRISKSIPKPLYIVSFAFECILFLYKIITLPDKLEKSKIFFLFFLSFVPLLWFSVTAQPTIIHVWFQYRLICASCFTHLLVFSRCLCLNRICIDCEKNMADHKLTH